MAQSRNYDFTNFQIAKSETWSQSINNGSKVTGYFGHASAPGAIWGFLDTDDPETVESFRVGDNYTYAHGINDHRTVVGRFIRPSGGAPRGFIYEGKVITELDGGKDAASAAAYGINNANQIVGLRVIRNRAQIFIYAAGNYTPLPHTFVAKTLEPRAINDKGQIVGWYTDRDGPHGFFYDGNHFTTLNAPNAVGTLAYGLNNRGQIAGTWQDKKGMSHGFVRDGDDYDSFDNPKALFTEAYGINDSGQISGAITSKFENIRKGYLATPTAGGPGSAQDKILQIIERQ